jgi:hypothetical protein
MLLLRYRNDSTQVTQEVDFSEIESKPTLKPADIMDLENKWHMPNGGLVILNFVDDASA